MGRKINKEAREAYRAAEMEKDTIYYLDFIPRNGHRVNRSTTLNDPWCVRLFGNPKGDQKIIDAAITAFEAKHNIKSWDEVAIRYQVNSLYYP